MDHDLLMLQPIYKALGVPAILTLEDSRIFNITVIDKTAGINVGDRVEVPTVVPYAAIRYAELTSLGMNADDIVHGTLAFNGFVWEVKNHKLEPNPSGERKGEVYAMLAEQNELASSES